MMNITEVDRPKSSRGVKLDLLDQVVETHATGKAIQVQLEPGTNYINWQGALRARVSRRGLRLRYNYDKDTNIMTVWAEDLTT